MAKRQISRERKARSAAVRKSDSEAASVHVVAEGTRDGGDGGQEILQSLPEDQQAGVFNEAECSARVARRAFELFERRGGGAGRDVEDWLEAERQVKEELLRESPAGSR
ncbi:MAG: hypothetical protein C4293_06025 [Nitrospiraceae bacterium]